MVIFSLSLFSILYETLLAQQVNHNSDLFKTFLPIYGYDLSTTDESGILLTTCSVSTKYDCVTSAFQKCISKVHFKCTMSNDFFQNAQWM